MGKVNSKYYGMEDKTKIKGFGGLLIVIASWNILSIIINASGRANISQIKLSCLLRNDNSIPESFFSVARTGYVLSLIFSIILIIVFFKKLKIYKYLEIVNFISRIVFLASLYHSFGEINEQSTQLADYVPVSILFSLLTITYMFFAYRAKNTFVNKVFKN